MDLLSPREAAALLGVSHSTLYRYLDADLLGSHKVGGKRKFRKNDVINLLNGAQIK
jgi:excisionase family DNA binding protein